MVWELTMCAFSCFGDKLREIVNSVLSCLYLWDILCILKVLAQ